MFTESDGRYYGIGSYVTIDETSNLPMLSGVFEDSPAQKAGLRDGDLIYEVDGATTQGLSLTEVVTLIKGPIDTDVVLTIVREGESDYLHITVTRGSVETPTVKHRMLDNNIGYLQITEFDDVTLSQFENAYDDLKKSGMKGLIIDLRSNPGGNLDTVVGICDDILPAGIVTYTVDKYGNKEEYYCHGTDPIDIPLAVLVNEYSASASELMTGAIRDYKVGVVVGKNTFGKGIVQQIYTLSDESGIKLTTSRYYTPNGECIHEVGIAPDIEVELDTDLYYAEESVDTQLNAAVEYIEGQIK
jgi:carboxyl-terminal processing protease